MFVCAYKSYHSIVFKSFEQMALETSVFLPSLASHIGKDGGDSTWNTEKGCVRNHAALWGPCAVLESDILRGIPLLPSPL